LQLHHALRSLHDGLFIQTRSLDAALDFFFGWLLGVGGTVGRGAGGVEPGEEVGEEAVEALQLAEVLGR
jgi:hypothetical protein